ncbi:MAG TPA: DUF1464 family protein [Gemmatimonadales bacterium]|nr:DUF1464 family protein [Gemmatimonadales bacterium]
MPRVIGIDPGTVSIDLLGLADGQVWLDRSLPTSRALADPDVLLSQLVEGGTPELIAGPSGYGLPLVPGERLTDTDLRLALLAAEGDAGGIGGLRRLLRALADSGLPVVFTPGVIHLPSVPSHRKLNRVDLGTADKVAAAALAMRDQADRLRLPASATSFFLLELGGAFTAALAVEQGQVVDGVGGTSGPIGWQAGGAWDGEVAFLAGTVTKAMLFQGGRAGPHADPDGDMVGLEAWLEGAHKAALALMAAVPEPREIFLSGRHAAEPEVHSRLVPRLSAIAPVRDLAGFAAVAKQGAQGAALLADGLAEGRHRDLVDALRLREAGGTALDYLKVISPAEARRRLGIT